ncbi:phosphatidylinositol 3 and 4-kinase-domain-containing protein [Vararia minispora EC-137]|uniref:Phosphatidylinositol 3 and 4-kinase-domain-containing protein n=1 Tax=Vararia minispora EC-137 TaxID=1314806 RepID=A0ACB8QKR3_9AGAM|nr:phosphatidylinositol 3 and 4-kinase-domain-containing protein [Vararia minispora EC-137]
MHSDSEGLDKVLGGTSELEATWRRIGSTAGLRRANHPGRIDLRKLDNAFKRCVHGIRLPVEPVARWTESIAQKMKRKKKKSPVHEKLEILRSVFDPPVPTKPASRGPIKTLDHKAPLTKTDFDGLIQAVKAAILDGIHPKMISKGSSGSYFARAKVEGRVQTVAVFKPKDEEPYGRLNPKTTKWLHRQLRWIIPFGRACLIPNLSYISEAAASLLDRRLGLNLVPRTELASLSSAAFFYDWIDRANYKNGRSLPDKIGSMQVFMYGYQDASDFLRKHPWPGRSITDTFDDSTHRTGNVAKRLLGALKVVCGRTGAEEDIYDEAEVEDERVLFDRSENRDIDQPFYWSVALQRSFREELEKRLADYLMLNTDRGADNYMIKYCEGEHEKSLVDVAPTRSVQLEMPMMTEVRASPNPNIASPVSSPSVSFASPPRITRTISAPHDDYKGHPHIHIAAIDNSLSFPHEHPKGWRSYTYGWLYLPVSVIGKPFSEKTRDHFLPLLTSKEWWEETSWQLRELFAVDPDFNLKMFQRQLSVIKGQAWNIVQSLRHEDEGPLELTRRTSALVHDDTLEILEEVPLDLNGPLSASITSLPPPSALPQKHARARSNASDFPPPIIRRMSTDGAGYSRPVPFSAKFKRVHPGTTGVTVLEHMERLDRVEASLERLTAGPDVVDDEEEQDVGDLARPVPSIVGALSQPETLAGPSSAPSRTGAAIMDLATVHELSSSGELSTTEHDAMEVDEEEDVAALSKSLSHLDVTTSSRQGQHRPMQVEERGTAEEEDCYCRGVHRLFVSAHSMLMFIARQRLEFVEKKPLLPCW